MERGKSFYDDVLSILKIFFFFNWIKSQFGVKLMKSLVY